MDDEAKVKPADIPEPDASSSAPPVAEKPRRATTEEPGERKLSARSIAFTVIFYGAIALVWIWNSETARQLVAKNWLPLTIIAALLFIAILVGWLRRDQFSGSGKRRVIFTIFVALPMLVLLVGALSRLNPPHQVILLRSVFLLIVCVMPALMYFLFIVSRKTSLLHEFFTRLSRLGLLEAQVHGTSSGSGSRQESGNERQARITSYVKKFEAIYGPLSPEAAEWFSTPSGMTGPGAPEANRPIENAGSVSSVFTSETAIPVVFATLLMGLGWLLALPPWEMIAIPNESLTVETLRHVLKPGPVMVNYAFLGAYFFSLQMLFRRYVRRDLRPSAYVSVSMRIVLAVIGVWALELAFDLLDLPEQAGGEDYRALLIMGFVVGAFPPVAWQVIQAAFRKITFSQFFVPSLNAAMPVSDLDGLTVWHEARLEEEDIENIPNMATADIVELLLNTRFPAERIVDWVDQALLYTHLGPDADSDEKGDDAGGKSSRNRLREHGIRSASALIAGFNGSVANGDQSEFVRILPGDGRNRIRSLVDTISINSNLQLIQRWRRRGADQTSGTMVSDLLADAHPAPPLS